LIVTVGIMQFQEGSFRSILCCYFNPSNCNWYLYES